MQAVIGKALATIEEVDDDLEYGPNGGFTCIASTPSEDRDGDNLYQEEWKTLPDHITVDLDHGMSVATTVGSGRPYFNADGNIQTDVVLSSIARAQEVRTLIKEGHVRTVSVAFMTDKTKKSGEPRRELLNLGIVAIPSNREAVILDSKALDARALEIAAERAAELAKYRDGVHSRLPETKERATDEPDKPGEPEPNEPVEDKAAEAEENVTDETKAADETKAVEEAPEIESKAPSGTGDGAALTQAIHDASVHLGAICYPLVSESEDPTGSSDGANKSVETEPEEKSLDLEAIKPEGMTMEQFKSALTAILTPESPEEPAPVEETAAASDADDWAMKTQLLKMRLRTRL